MHASIHANTHAHANALAAIWISESFQPFGSLVVSVSYCHYGIQQGQPAA